MKWTLAALSLLLCKLSGTQVAAQTRRALLIGTNTYQPEGTSAQHLQACWISSGRIEVWDG
jgi:hypothetical protein